MTTESQIINIVNEILNTRMGTRAEKILKLLKLTNSEESKQEIPSNIPNEESNNIVPLNPTPSDNNITDIIYEHLVANKLNDKGAAVKNKVNDSNITVINEVNDNSTVVNKGNNNAIVVNEVNDNTIIVNQVNGNTIIVNQVNGNTIIVNQVNDNTIIVNQKKLQKEQQKELQKRCKMKEL
ncbi:unnamed protein product [Timema podura]|uniref:Uncharacterized protein n=1 Tax=Timema podura TaxID=61482 RepID=A0ABN7NKI5_TIMPD|nr:unnamed protein product [Timema podura]